MKAAEKIKLLRILNCLSQEYLANIIGLRQKHVAHIESGKRFIEAKIIKNLADFFGCSVVWLGKNKGPAVEKGWLYVEIPTKEIKTLSKPLKNRQINKIERALSDLFEKFLKRGKVKKYSVVEITEAKQKFYVFQLSRKSSLILKASPEFFGVIEAVIQDTKVKQVKTGAIEKQLSDLISHPGSSEMTCVLELHNICGFNNIAKHWKDSLFENERHRREQIIYRQWVNKVCREIVNNRIKHEDILNALNTYCESKDDFDFIESWK